RLAATDSDYRTLPSRQPAVLTEGLSRSLPDACRYSSSAVWAGSPGSAFSDGCIANQESRPAEHRRFRTYGRHHRHGATSPRFSVSGVGDSAPPYYSFRYRVQGTGRRCALARTRNRGFSPLYPGRLVRRSGQCRPVSVPLGSHPLEMAAVDAVRVQIVEAEIKAGPDSRRWARGSRLPRLDADRLRAGCL